MRYLKGFLKSFALFLFSCYMLLPVYADGFNAADCTYNGIPLYGKVQVVEHFADFNVQVVEHFADLDVKVVKHFPDSCGKWIFVTSFPDFKISFVNHFADFKIHYVNSFPGAR